jgi:TadE-like protein
MAMRAAVRTRPEAPASEAASRRPRRSRGQSLVEFSLVLPVFLLMVFAIIDMGRVIWAYDNLASAAREGARYASVHGASKVTVCPTGPSLVGAPASGCPTWTPDSKEPTRISTRTFLVDPGSSVTVYVCYFTTTACTNNADEANATNGRGEFVTVKITSRVNLITPALLGFTGFNITGSSTVLINN